MFAKKLFKVCLKYSKNYQDAQDTLQDSFLLIFKNIKKFKHTGSFEGWIKRITINVALKKFRDNSKTYFDAIEDSQIPDETDDNELYFDDNELNLNDLLFSIRELPPKYQLVFNLFVLDQYSHEEIAEILNISVGTSKSNLSRARKLLRKKITAKLKSEIL